MDNGQRPADNVKRSADLALHMIGNAHLDPVWLWRWQEGYAEIKATFRSALDRMKEFPEFVFTCAGAAYYRWVEENAPEMFAELRERVAEGRWVIVGGWWISNSRTAGEMSAIGNPMHNWHFARRSGLF